MFSDNANTTTSLLHSPVFAEVLKPKDIQQPNRFPIIHWIGFGFENGNVDFADNPDEHATVDAFDERVTHVHRLTSVHHRRDALATRKYRASRQRVTQLARVHLRKHNNNSSDNYIP